MTDKPLHPLAIYGSHDASICIKPAHDTYRVYELERLTRVRNYSLNTDPDYRPKLIEVKNLIESEYGIKDYGSCFYAQINPEIKEALQEIFGFNHFEEMPHHSGHAACGLFQSSFEQCLVISHDSGGHELNEDGVSTFCIYLADKRKGVKKIGKLPLDICSPYTFMAMPVSEIYKTDEYSRFLSYAGKIMGLAAYGKVRPEWVPHFEDFYYGVATTENLKKLGDKIGLDFSKINTIKGQTSADIAATSQYVYEKCFFTAIRPFVNRYELPVVLTGGGALNVLANQSFRNLIPRAVFVPCNPNDCGLSLGFMLLRNPPAGNIQVQYNGFGLLDKHELPTYVEKYGAREATVKDLARLISKGKIVGVVNGNSEVGPRALGNRSILCDPSKKNMKDKLNIIKQREFFRPFAPVCKQEDVNKYFEFDGEATFMSYAPPVREQYRKKLPAIVHNDNTARVQTVRKDQNEFLYSLIDAVETITETGVVLNTSFNIKGEPILTRIEDALHVLETTAMDCAYIEGYLFEKK